MPGGMSVRHFLLDADDQLWAIPRRLIEALAHGGDRLPQYAGQSLKVITAFLDLLDGKPQRLSEAQGSYWHFDDRGSIQRNLAQSGMEAWITHDLVCEERASTGPVVSISARRRRQEWERTHRWEPGPAEITRIIHAIWPEQASRPLARPKWLQGIRKRRPPMTYAAKNALRECDPLVFGVERHITELTEPGLKAFIHGANERATVGSVVERTVWSGVAQAGEARLEVLRARNRKGGTWVAALELIVSETDGTGRVHPIAAERCAGRDKAEARARELVREHADKVGHGISLEVSVVPEVEWEETED